MSDAQAASTENGVPTVVAQETKLEETQETKACYFSFPCATILTRSSISCPQVFVGNLAYSTNDDGLKALFEPVQSDVLSVQVIKHGPKPAGYGFASFRTSEAAQRAIDALHTKEVDGRALVVELAKAPELKEKEKRAKRRPGRRGTKAVPGEVTDAEANGEAPKAEATSGTEEAARPKKQRRHGKASSSIYLLIFDYMLIHSISQSKPKRKATEGGEAAEGPVVSTIGEEAAPGDASKKKARKFRYKHPHRAPGEEPVGEPSKTVVFVANLGFSVDETALDILFTEAGFNVVSSRIARIKWGGQSRRSRGFGFVGVSSEEEQKKAIEVLNGKKVGDREIAVKVAINVPRDDEEPAAVAETLPAEEPSVSIPATTPAA